MELLNFLRNNEDWEKLLAAEPYNLEIRHDKGYVLFKYNQFLSDFNLKLVREARGSIFTKINDVWDCVCYPFEKFGNWGEPYAATPYMDWDSTQFQQKVDGSLIKMWFNEGDWHISTNGTIDAFKCDCGDTTFGDLVLEATRSLPFFWSKLRPSYTYMFELTSPQNQLVCQYGDKPQLWYLGCRNMVNFCEEPPHLYVEGLQFPHVFNFNSLDECIAAAHLLGSNEEGWVCVDSNYNRIKIKGDEYLRISRIRENGPLTFRRVVELWQSDSLDDYLAYFPNCKDLVVNCVAQIQHLINSMEQDYISIPIGLERKEFAAYASKSKYAAYLFARLDNKVNSAADYLHSASVKKIEEWCS